MKNSTKQILNLLRFTDVLCFECETTEHGKTFVQIENEGEIFIVTFYKSMTTHERSWNRLEDSFDDQTVPNVEHLEMYLNSINIQISI